MNRVNVSISVDKLAHLIKTEQLCIAELSCLDKASKQLLWQLCLINCNKRISCKVDCDKNCNATKGLFDIDAALSSQRSKTQTDVQAHNKPIECHSTR